MSNIIDSSKKIEQCNIVYHKLGETDRSAMPLGNGELAASVWVNKKGELCFYLSRSDALTEIDRTVKLGMFKLQFEPIQFTEKSYKQELVLLDGMIEIQGHDGSLSFWIDSEEDVLCIEGNFSKSVSVSVQYENWRTENNFIGGEFNKEFKIYESSDIVEQKEQEILFYHYNEKSIVADVAKLQKVDEFIDDIPDFLKGRIFGGFSRLKIHKQNIQFCVATKSEQIDVASFKKEVKKTVDEFISFHESKRRTKAKWNNYWSKSYIFVTEDEKIEKKPLDEITPFCKEMKEFTCDMDSGITRAYVLTKYMTQCCSHGKFPILYNGMLFNLCPGGNLNFNTSNFGRAYTEQPGSYTLKHNPDERSWCVEHLWQNIRHPYASMLERGEGDSLKVLFKYYRNFWDINRHRAEKYYKAKGQHNTEMTLSCGLLSPAIYGINRDEKPMSYVQNRWGGAVEISPGLELANMMLDYVEFYQDREYFSEVLTYIKELLLYIETRFPEIENGKMKIGPINCIETYRDTYNPITIVAGIHTIIERILLWEIKPDSLADYFKNYKKKVPEIKGEFEQGKQVLAPAEIYNNERYNVEIPELYTIYPFKNYTFYNSNKETAVNTYFLRTSQYGLRKCFRIGEKPSEPSYSGWQYLGVVAAILGLKDEAAEILINNCNLTNPGTRFPAMWGPIYDAVPDTDHGANILNQLQKMIMQTDRGKIYLLPAFPQKWNVEFKLWADKDTVIEGKYINGKLETILVTPKEREKDIYYQNKSLKESGYET